VFLICFTEENYLVNIESVVRINLQHADYETSKFLTVFFGKWRELTFRNSLEKFIKVQVLFIRRSKWRPKCTQLVPNAAHTPDI